MTEVPPMWEQPLDRVLGAKSATALAKLDLATVGDLMRHYPRRYGDPGRLTDFTDLRPGEQVTVIARVSSARTRRTSNGRSLLSVVITDGVGELDLSFFAKSPYLLQRRLTQLRAGRMAMFSGKVGVYRRRYQLAHPDYEFLDSFEDQAQAVTRAPRPIPIYPAAASLPTWRIRTAVETVLGTLLAEDVPDPLPVEVRERYDLPSRYEALQAVHAPETDQDWKRGRHRLRFEEALVLQTALAQRRARHRAEPAVARLRRPGGILDAFDARLPFELTEGQREVGDVIGDELGRSVPMHRLLQGEVGSGKTLVALRAMLQVVDDGSQAALLAPTEVLAVQHGRSISAMLGPLADAGMLGGADHSTRVAVLTGSMPAAARRKALADAASGAAGIVIGTHALLSEIVQFADLGLVVVDEQHRFGVEQRDALRAKSERAAHLLVMTATPIPRTVAMTVFGDLETSTLREIPAGRAGVSTHLVPAENAAWMARVWQLIAEQVAQGGRAFVVCPRITESDAGEGLADDEGSRGPQAAGHDDRGEDVSDPRGEVDGGGRPRARVLASVDLTHARLREEPALAGIEIGVMHGRMTGEEKDAAMADFVSGRAPVLVTTTVIEVGVDVPEATVMVLLDADRFGLSQLHQLRGRIGRGERPGTCLAVTSAEPGSAAMERLEAFAATTDGFELARVDLTQRREGDVLGAAQSGRSNSLAMLRVLSDADLIADARQAARSIIDTDPELLTHPVLAAAIADHLSGGREEYLERS